jgi:hypothetical protein
MFPIKKATALAAMTWLLAGGLAHAGTTAPADSHEFLYLVHHSLYGDIGTYSNKIEKQGDTTIVRTEAHLKVSVLGISLHNEDSARTERWQAGRLMSFHGVTNKNGHELELTGQAEGNSFVISSPQGTVTAPATVHPANPWSANFLATRMMMRVDTGEVVPVHISDGVDVVVKIDGEPVAAREYQVDGVEKYKVWLDDHNVPVMFDVHDGSGVVTFILTKHSTTTTAARPAARQ